jgi:transcription-repair coupling factor (superfamily II helicase)
MLYQLLKTSLNRSQSIEKFREFLAKKENHILFYGMNRSAKSLLLADCFFQTNKNVIFICPDDKIAEDYAEDIEIFTSNTITSFLPDYEVLAYEKRSPHYMIRVRRLQTLSKIAQNELGIFTISFRAFIRFLTEMQTFRKNIQILQTGVEYNIDLLVSNLVSYGYQREYQVSKVGEFARRGCIFDIYCPNHESPARIEFFSDEIISIHYFHIQNQRSFGNNLSTFMIIPMREFSLHDVTTDKDYFWNKIHHHGFYDGIEMDIPQLMKQTETFIQYFHPENCLLFWEEFQFVPGYFDEIIEETQTHWLEAKKQNNGYELTNPDAVFANKDYLNNIVKTYQNYFLSNTFQTFPLIAQSCEIITHHHHNLHGNLELLEKDLALKMQKQFQIFIQSDNSGQRNRMRNLLTVSDEHVHYSIGVLQNGFTIDDAKLCIYTDHEIFSRYRSRSKESRFSKQNALIDYDDIKPGDYIVHITHGIGVFEGLKKISVSGNEIECMVLAYANNDKIYVPTFQLSLVAKYVSEEGIKPVIHKIGGKKWELTKSQAKKQIELIAQDLIDLYAKRKVKKGIAFSNDTEWQKEMENSFIYEETQDQLASTQEIKADMESDLPMERLLCGDVGFGKTEVAIRVAFKAVMSGWQVAVLVPTTLLAEQHYMVFRERMAEYPVQIAMFCRFRTLAQLKKDVHNLAVGNIDIAIGTHRLLSEDIQFKKLGLLIIDEEHRFGVRHKDKLRLLKTNVDTLYMSATPIPRTLYMALSNLKEMSLIQTSPKARLPIRTVIVPYDMQIIKDAIMREIERGGQVYFIHNRVKTIDSIAESLKKLLSKVRFGIGHGQLSERILEQVMLDFAEHKFDVLIATTIIESGIDIPNVNTMLINRADTFGLAQLYQMRGRVGRSNRRAYAYLIIPNQLQEEARKRLETLIEYESLGSGYQIAMRDMELRGVGMLLGTKQSGIINTIGYNYYNRLLETATQNMMQNKNIWDEDTDESKELFLDADAYFPTDYISDEKERLRIYKRLLHLQNQSEFDEMKEELNDRFGALPIEAEQTIEFYKLKFLIEKSILHRLYIKKNEIQLEFSKTRLPSKDLISKFIQNFPYEVNFETVNYFKIIFHLRTETKMEKFKIAQGILLFLQNK